MERNISQPALIGIAHGSRHPDSAAVTESLLMKAGELLGIEAHAAYLEDFASPSIPTLASELKEHGYENAIAVPLLFTSAYHANEDAPSEIRDAHGEHGFVIKQAGVLGTHDDVVDVLAQHLATHESPAKDGPVLLLAVGSSRKGANASVDSLAERLAAKIGREVFARFATCSPSAKDHIAEHAGEQSSGGAGTVLPLFTAPGVLLDMIRKQGAPAGWDTLPHLGESLAPLVAARYQEVLGKESSAGF